MKNTTLIIGVIIVLLAAAGGYYFMQNRTATSTEGPSEKKMAVEEGGSAMLSLKDLMNLGTSQVCTYSYSDEATTMEGTTYVSNGNVRTDYSGTVAGQPEMSGGMILDSEYMYSWNSSMSQGMKIARSTFEEGNMEEYAAESESYNEQIDPNEKVEYNCSNWRADESMFVPPSDITFSDFSGMMEQSQQMMQDGMSEEQILQMQEEASKIMEQYAQ